MTKRDEDYSFIDIYKLVDEKFSEATKQSQSLQKDLGDLKSEVSNMQGRLMGMSGLITLSGAVVSFVFNRFLGKDSGV